MTIHAEIKQYLDAPITVQSFGTAKSMGKIAAESVISVLVSGFNGPAFESVKKSMPTDAIPKGKSVTYTKGENATPIEEDTPFYVRPNGENYYARQWEHSNKTDVEVVSSCGAKGISILMYGEPGTGKTALAEAAFGERLLTVLGTGDTEVADFVGGYTIDGKGGFMWVDGPLLTAMKEGRPMLIDEIGIIDPKVMTVVYSVMDGRGEINVTANPEMGTVVAQPGFYILAATNPNAPGVRLSEALLSRFTIHVEIMTDWTLAQRLKVPARAITVGKNLTSKRENGQIRWAPQMREVLAFRDLAADFGIDFAIANMIASAPEGDRPVVTAVFAQTFGKDIQAARV